MSVSTAARHEQEYYQSYQERDLDIEWEASSISQVNIGLTGKTGVRGLCAVTAKVMAGHALFEVPQGD